MKYTYFLFVIILLNCKDKDRQYKAFKNIEICNLIDSLNYRDNLYRSDPRIEDPFFKILDSIRLSEGIDTEMYKSFTVDKQLAYGRKARAIVNKLPPANKKLFDSLIKLQIKLDDQNTETLLEYIKENSYYPTKKITGCDSQPDLVFRHSHSKYFSVIKIVIEDQLKKGHITEFQYSFYTQHFERVLDKIDTVKTNSEITIFESFKNN